MAKTKQRSQALVTNEPLAAMRAARGDAEKFADALGSPERDNALDRLTGETIKVAQSWFGRRIYDENPDDLVRNKGINLRVYRRMMADPYIKAAVMQVKAAVVSPGWEIQPPQNPTERETDATNFVKWNFALGNMASSVDDIIWAALGAIENGFSIQEKVYGPVVGGRWDGLWRIKAIKDKDPDQIRFDLDPFANVTSIVNLAYNRAGDTVDIRRVFYFVNNPQYGNPWGQSELRAAHRAWILTDVVYKLWAMYAERNVTPLMVGKFPPGNQAVKDRMEEIIENVQFSTAITLPSVEGISIDVMNTSGFRGTLDWSSLIENLNKEKAIGILTAFLGMEEGSNVGSRAATQVHADKASEVSRLFAKRVAGAFTISVIAPLVTFNFGPEVRSPVFVWKGREAMDIMNASIMVQNLYNSGVPLRLEGLRRVFGELVAGDEDSDVIKKMDAFSFSEKKRGCCDHPDKFQERGEVKFTRPLNRIEKFAEPELRRLVKWHNAVGPGAKLSLRSAFREVFREVLDAIERRKVIEKGDESQAVKIKAAVGPVKDALTAMLVNARMVGFEHVIDMIRRRKLFELVEDNQDIREEARLDRSALKIEKFAEVGDPEDILSVAEVAKFYRDRLPMTKTAFRELLETLGDEAERQAVTAAGMSKQAIEGQVQKLMIRAINDGMDQVQFRNAFRNLEAQYTGRAFDRVGDVAEGIPDWQVENIYRTNMTSAYNDGQRVAFEDPVVEAVLPAFQFSAILDDRTTEVCQEWDNYIARVSDPIWNSMRPPVHWMCRSTLIPIDILEYNPDMDTKVRPDVGPAEGFGKIAGLRAQS